MEQIGLTVSEEMSFENVDGRRMPVYILGKIIKGSPNGLFHIWYSWSDLWRKSAKILKNGFRSPERGSKMKPFPLKIWHLEFSFLLFSKITFFAKFFKKKIIFYHFY